ncbi:uncharacterized protein [Apostichopus japonicus]|uniref:uncharacterized protein isoform X3 n=1 Tax=Stichopus japonicus TaxID=307972 RepID=UPI003AB908D4
MNGYCLFMKKKMQANGKEWKKLSDKDRMEYDSRRVQAKKEYFESLEKNVLTLPQEEAAKYQSELAASKVPSKSRINIQKELKPSAEGFFILSTGVAGEERAGGTPGGKRFLQQTEVVEGFRSCYNYWYFTKLSFHNHFFKHRMFGYHLLLQYQRRYLFVKLENFSMRIMHQQLVKGTGT